MGAYNLPSELKSLAAAFCPFSSLSMLARLNREFQTHAEIRLYRTISVQTYDGTGLGALKTLGKCAQKAQFVKSCNVEFDRVPRPSDDSALRGLLDELKRPSVIHSLNIILSSKSFLLAYLFVDDACDLQLIVDSQEKLKILGVFQEIARVTPLPKLRVGGERGLAVLGLFRSGATLPYYNNLVLLPELLDLELAQNFGDLVRSCTAINMGSAIDFDPDHVSDVSMYIRSPSHSSEIFQAFIQNISRIFDVWLLSVYVQCDPRDKWIAKLVDVLAPQNITIRRWNEKSTDIYDSHEVYRGPREAFSRFLLDILVSGLSTDYVSTSVIDFRGNVG
ncbi:hypothetical protein NMY22_g18383 [Coprinellus aureogranulatus]|nr:hypothetical protein NMY22_g18383 [Coprinellus aureogranulatus]